MRFRHKRTGAIIEVSSRISGPWEPVDGGEATAQVSPEPETIEEAEAEKKPKARRKKKS